MKKMTMKTRLLEVNTRDKVEKDASHTVELEPKVMAAA